MQCAVSNTHSSIELVSFHSSPQKTYGTNLTNSIKVPATYFFDFLQYIRAIPDVERKITFYKSILERYKLSEVTDEYLDCLLVNAEYDAIHNFLGSVETISNAQRLCVV